MTETALEARLFTEAEALGLDPIEIAHAALRVSIRAARPWAATEDKADIDSELHALADEALAVFPGKVGAAISIRIVEQTMRGLLAAERKRRSDREMVRAKVGHVTAAVLATAAAGATGGALEHETARTEIELTGFVACELDAGGERCRLMVHHLHAAQNRVLGRFGGWIARHSTRRTET